MDNNKHIIKLEVTAKARITLGELVTFHDFYAAGCIIRHEKVKSEDSIS
jgi:hypothetical protein